MKINLTIDFDADNPKDLAAFNKLTDAIKLLSESNETTSLLFSHEDAWLQCSWEIIAFAVTILTICDGVTEKGTYAFFDSLLDPAATVLCGALTERGISSRVGRTAVICKKMGGIRLLEVAIRRKDQAKRVYIANEAKEALLKLVRGKWGRDFEAYLKAIGVEAPNFNDL